MHDPQFIKSRNKFPAFRTESDLLGIASGIPGASGPGQADQSQALFVPPPGILGVANGIRAFHENADAERLVLAGQFDSSVLNHRKAVGFQLLVDPELRGSPCEGLLGAGVLAGVVGVRGRSWSCEDRSENQPDGAGGQVRHGNAARGGIGAWLVNGPSFDRDAGQVKMSVDPWLVHQSSVPQST